MHTSTAKREMARESEQMAGGVGTDIVTEMISKLGYALASSAANIAENGSYYKAPKCKKLAFLCHV